MFIMYFNIITDNTICPATWLGKDGQCFKVFVTHKPLEAARLQCFQDDSYLFNPTKSSPSWSILEILNNIDVLKNDTDLLMSGIRTIFFNTTYVTSNGIRLSEFCVSSPYLGIKIGLYFSSVFLSF